MACLEDVKILRQRGCEFKGKWTSSHTAIIGNERADTLAKLGTKDRPCPGPGPRYSGSATDPSSVH